MVSLVGRRKKMNNIHFPALPCLGAAIRNCFAYTERELTRARLAYAEDVNE